MRLFSRSVDKSLRVKIYNDLQNNAEDNVERMNETLKKNVESNNMSLVKDHIDVIKRLIKDKVPAKAKYHGLQVIAELMRTRSKPVVNYFNDKICSRLSKLAMFEAKNPDPKRGERCLDAYNPARTKEDRVYALKFFALLHESWREWDEAYSSEYKKIREKMVKLRPILDNTNINQNDIESVKGGSVREAGGSGFAGMEDGFDDKEDSDFADKDVSKSSVSDISKSKSFASQPSNQQQKTAIKLKDAKSAVSKIEEKQPKKSMGKPDPNQTAVLMFFKEAIDVRAELRDAISSNNHDAFTPYYSGLYNAVESNVKNLEGFKAGVKAASSYDDDFKKLYEEECVLQAELLKKFDMFGIMELDYEGLKKFVLGGPVGKVGPNLRAAISRNDGSNNGGRASQGRGSNAFGEQNEEFGATNNNGYNEEFGVNDENDFEGQKRNNEGNRQSNAEEFNFDFNTIGGRQSKAKTGNEFGDFSDGKDKVSGIKGKGLNPERMFSFGGGGRGDGVKGQRNAGPVGKTGNSAQKTAGKDSLKPFGETSGFPTNGNNDFNFGFEAGDGNNVSDNVHARENKGDDFGFFGSNPVDSNIHAPNEQNTPFGMASFGKQQGTGKFEAKSIGPGEDSNKSGSPNTKKKGNLQSAMNPFGGQNTIGRESLGTDFTGHNDFNLSTPPPKTKSTTPKKQPLNKSVDFHDFGKQKAAEETKVEEEEESEAHEGHHNIIDDESNGGLEGVNDSIDAGITNQAILQKNSQNKPSALNKRNVIETTKQRKKDAPKSDFGEGNEPTVHAPKPERTNLINFVETESRYSELERLRAENEFFKEQSELLFEKLNKPEPVSQPNDNNKREKTEPTLDEQQNDDHSRELDKLNKVKSKVQLYTQMNSQLIQYAEQLKKQIGEFIS